MKTLSAVVFLALALFIGAIGAGPVGAGSSSTAIVPSPNTSSTLDNSLESIDCVSESFCVAVGSFNDGSAEKSLVLIWDGSNWATTPSPNNSIWQTHLLSVSCVSETFCVAVGFGDSTRLNEPLVMMWDGMTWTIVSSTASSPSSFLALQSVSCFSPTFCLAVGTSGQAPMQTLTMKWDGMTWTQVPSPNTSPSLSNSLRGVSCVTTTMCTAVGFYNNGTSSLTLVLTWNGATWTQVPSPNPWRGTSPSQNNVLQSVSCLSQTMCTAVGSYGYLSGGRSLVLNWDGSQWLQVESPDPTIYQSPLRSVSCLETNRCVAVGSYKEYGVPLSEPLIAWSGAQWLQETTPSAGSSLNQLVSVSCFSDSNCFAVGSYKNGSINQTLIMSLVRPAPIATPTFTG
jgi:hypothetical protein